MAPKLYAQDVSPPCRAVQLTAAHLGISLEHVETNMYTQDHLKPEYIKLNPQHTIPTLEDDGKVIWDSHAIMIYLVSKYGKDDSLYPKDIYKRAVVDQRLHFDSGVLFALLRRIVRNMKFRGIKTIIEEYVEEGNQGYEFLDKFLEGRKWVAGDAITLADFSLLTTATGLDVLVPISATKYPNIVAWIKRAQQLPYYNLNQKGVEEVKALIKRMTA